MTEDVKSRWGCPKKLSLQRRTKTTVSTTAGGKAKEVQVEVRKTYGANRCGTKSGRSKIESKTRSRQIGSRKSEKDAEEKRV